MAVQGNWPVQGLISVDGKSIEVEAFGAPPAEAPTLVLLHEGLGSVKLWHDIPARLASQTGLGVLLYSRTGYGQSDPVELPRPLDYMTIEATEMLPQLLDTLGVQQAILVGHSDGATIAAIYAGTVADFRVRGLILIAPHFFTESVALTAIKKCRATYENGDLRQRMAKYHRDPDNAFYGWCDSWLHPDFTEWDITEVIDYIRVPVLAVQGREDQYGTLAQLDELQSRCYAPVDLLTIDNCGHTPHLEHTSQVIDGVAEFCNRLQQIESATAS